MRLFSFSFQSGRIPFLLLSLEVFDLKKELPRGYISHVCGSIVLPHAYMSFANLRNH